MYQLRNHKLQFFGIAIVGVIIYTLLYVFLPALSASDGSFWTLIGLILAIAAFYSLLNTFFQYDGYSAYRKSHKYLFYINVAFYAVWFLAGISSWEVLRASSYRNLVQVKNKDFQQEFEDISQNPAQFFTLDLDSAIRLGDQAIGNINHPEWYNVDPEFNLITYRGKRYRLSPLVYESFLKYIRARSSGIPGYVLIDADTQKASFVKLKEPIRFSPSAYFGYNLKRHLRTQFFSYIFTDSFLEIDEDGKPYFVTGVLKAQIGVFGGKKLKSFILTDASNGKSVEYAIEAAPKWVDHVFTLEYLEKLAFWHFEYVEGFFNSIFSKTNVNRTSYYYRDRDHSATSNFYGYNSFYLKNGDVAFISGVTPANVAEVNKGFISMNAKTGEMTYYAVPGSEESRVQKSAQAIFQNYGYIATYPTIVNVSSIPTYMMALKNNAGLIQQYAFVRISDYNTVGTGPTIEEAISNYKNIVGNSLISAGNLNADEIHTISFTLKNMYAQDIDGTTHYYYLHKGKIYKASAKVNELQVTYQIGDKVTITYVDGLSDISIVKSITK